MSREMLPESVSRERDRMNEYAYFAQAYAYPDDRFFEVFPQLTDTRNEIQVEYDRLFRNGGLWLYTSEYTAKGHFQKSNSLADIMGFYRAFGLKIEGERPDALNVEFEFMHYLVFKWLRAVEQRLEDWEEKITVCREAQAKFFSEHLYPGSRAVADRILAGQVGKFYPEITRELISFLDQETQLFEGATGGRQ